MDTAKGMCYNTRGDLMLKTMKNSVYLYEERGGTARPFFWLGDTAWLLLQKLDLDEAEAYLDNRAARRFNVVQAVLAHDENFGRAGAEIDFNDPAAAEEYWKKAEAVTELAEKRGIYAAWLPVWGSMVKKGLLNQGNAAAYAEFLAERLGGHENVIWVLGGDIRGENGFEVWKIMAATLKAKNPERLITFHPFGRTCSADRFVGTGLLDFDMFQSGHRRYDQSSLGAWDDNAEKEDFFGEDNWKYVQKCLAAEAPKPVLDGEPSYEGIHQGLHDFSQPFWQARAVRRYAYWSVFEGACGHTYGANSVMQFYKPSDEKPSYDAREYWTDGINLPGGMQMKYLYELMTSVDFASGKHNDGLVSNEGSCGYDRITAFSGRGFAFIYDFSGRPFKICAEELGFKPRRIEWFDPTNGNRSAADVGPGGEFVPPVNAEGGADMVLALRA